jgi:hypothetical protein
MTQSGSGQILVFDLGLRLDEPSIKSKAHDMADEASPRLNPTSAPLDDQQRSFCVADSIRT